MSNRAVGCLAIYWVLMAAFIPLTIIASLNALFGLEIPITPRTWLAALMMFILLSPKAPRISLNFDDEP